MLLGTANKTFDTFDTFLVITTKETMVKKEEMEVYLKQLQLQAEQMKMLMKNQSNT